MNNSKSTWPDKSGLPKSIARDLDQVEISSCGKAGWRMVFKKRNNQGVTCLEALYIEVKNTNRKKLRRYGIHITIDSHTVFHELYNIPAWTTRLVQIAGPKMYLNYAGDVAAYKSGESGVFFDVELYLSVRLPKTDVEIKVLSKMSGRPLQKEIN